MKLRVREACEEDFEKVYTLLRKLNSTSLSQDDWRKITRPYFAAPITTYGYVLEHEEEGAILGFLGTIFSERTIDGQTYKFCNIHSWIVSPEAKSGGINLLMKVLRLKDYVVTNFTASEVPYQIFQSLQFTEMAYTNYKLLPVQSFVTGLFARYKVALLNKQNAASLLNSAELDIYHSHKDFENVQMLWLGNGQEHCLLVSKRKLYVPRPLKKVPLLKDKLALAHIHYLSNPSVFTNAYASTLTALALCFRLKVAGLVLSDAFITEGDRLKNSVYSSKRPYMLRHSQYPVKKLDTLYSEIFILDL